MYLPLSRTMRAREKHRTRRTGPNQSSTLMREMLVFIYVRVHLGAAWLCGDDGVVRAPRIPREQVRAHVGTCGRGAHGEPASPHSLRRLPENFTSGALQEAPLSSN